MRIFHQVNSLIVRRNLWLIFLNKIWLFSYLVKLTSNNFKNSQDSKSALIFSLALLVVEFLAIFH